MNPNRFAGNTSYIPNPKYLRNWYISLRQVLSKVYKSFIFPNITVICTNAGQVVGCNTIVNTR
jgi:hypothetical protein